MEALLRRIQRLSTYFKELIFLMAISLIVIDTFIVPVTLTSLGLFGIAVAPYLAYLFRKIELPGGVNIEMRDLEEATDKLDTAGLIAAENDDQASYLVIGEHDPNLALVGFRIEVEKRLTSILREIGEDTILSHIDKSHALGKATSITRRRYKALAYMEQRKKISFIDRLSTTEKLSLLSEIGVLRNEEVSALRDLMPMLNQAAHGGVVQRAAYDWAMDTAPSLLSALDARARDAKQRFLDTDLDK